MSAPLSLSAEQVRQIADALDAMTEMTRRTGVNLDPYGGSKIGIGQNCIAYSWDEGTQAYVIDDRNGD